MLNVLHRTNGEAALLDRSAREAAERLPPSTPEPPAHREPGGGWPFRARVLVAVLAVLALAGAVGTIVGFARGDASTSDTSTVSDLRDSVNDLSAERDLMRAARDEATVRVASLESSLTAVEVERDAALGRVDELRADLESADGDRATLEAELSDAEASLAAATSERDQLSGDVAEASAALDELEADLAGVEADLAAQVSLTSAAVTERDALAALFPLTFDASLYGADLAGDYDVDIASVYCDGFSNCGVLPQFDELTIVEMNNGWLRVEIDGFVDAGLFLVDGSLFAVAESTTAVPDCAGVPRRATVSLTLYAHGLTVADDGSYAIDDLGASMMVGAPSVASCGRGLAFYGLELTP